MDDELRALENAALAELPPRQRNAFILRAVEGLTYKQVGAAMGISPKTAENEVAAARAKLQVLLAPVARDWLPWLNLLPPRGTG